VRFAVPRKDSLHLTARKPAYTTRQSLAGETVGLKVARSPPNEGAPRKIKLWNRRLWRQNSGLALQIL
jgi:hypothetical protein